MRSLAARSPLLTWLLLIGIVATGCASAPVPSSSASVPATAVQYPGWPAMGAILGDPDFVPILISSEAVVGQNRLLVTVADSSQALIAAPDLPVKLRFYDLATDSQTAASEVQGVFGWLLQGTKGLYVAITDLPRAGEWGLEAVGTGSTGERSSRMVFTVTSTSSTPALGAPAPPSDTLTATDAKGIALISTDPAPDPSFYALSVRQAIAAGKPFVLVFASPLLCTSATCGPALEGVKAIASAYRDRVNFIHVEPYETHPAAGLHVGNPPLQPTLGADGRPKVVAAVTEWGLLSEPYVFVVAADGTLSAKLEGVAYHDELIAALDAVLR